MDFGIMHNHMIIFPLLVAATVSTNITVVVTASPIAQDERNTPDGAEVVEIGAAQLGRLSAQDLPTALRHVPGVTVSRFSPIGSFGGAQGGSVFVRGTGESRPGGSLTILQDGVPAVGTFFNHPLMDLTPIDFAESLTVVKTPRPRTVPNAFSAVEMTTWRQREAGYGGAADLAYGRFRSLLSTVKAGVKEGPFDFAAGAAHRQSEGARDHSAARLDSAFVRTGLDLGKTEYLSFIYHFADSEVEDPGKRHAPTPKVERFATQMNTYTLRLESEREYLRGASALFFTDGWIEWRKDHIQDGNPNSPWGWSKSRWATYGYRGLYDVPVGDFTGSFGLDTIVEEGRTRTIRGKDGQVTFGGPWQREITTSPYLGARYDWHLDEDLTLTPSVGTRYHFNTKFDDEWAPSAALDFGTSAAGIYASWARGIHYPGLIFLQNEADCDAERMDAFNVGVRGNWEDVVTARLCAFHNRIRDRIDQTAVGYRNAGKADVSGTEATVRVNPTETVGLYGGVSLNAAQQKRLSRLPRWTATLGASWRLCEYVHLDVDAEYVAKMYSYTSRAAEVKDLAEVSAFWTMNVRLALDTRVCLPIDGEWYVAVENVLNRHYEYFPGYEMPGTMLYCGMKIRF